MNPSTKLSMRHAHARAIQPRFARKNFKFPSPATRLPGPRALDQAAAELSSAIGALAFSGAALYGLAMSIRSANSMDEHDARRAELAMTLTETVEVEVKAVPSVTAVIEKIETTSVEPVVDQVATEKRAEEARSWISGWRQRSESAAKAAAEASAAAAAAEASKAAAEERERIEAAHAERLVMEEARAAERKAQEAEERALAAAKAVAAKEAELAAMKARAEAQVAQRAKQARDWIGSWQKKTASTPPSPADPAMAAAVIKEMTEDAPVGVQKSTPAVLTPEPVVVGTSGDATQKAPQPVRRVSITAEYETKISSLLSSYEATKQKQREAALRQPKQVVEISAEELRMATKKTNPVVLFFLRIVAMIQACFAYVKSMFSGSGSGSGSSPVTA